MARAELQRALQIGLAPKDAALCESALSDLSRGRCFIATAVYGDYDCPQVLALREFRDRVLLTSAAGRALVRAYYHLSPPLARALARSRVAQAVGRRILDPIARWASRRRIKQ